MRSPRKVAPRLDEQPLAEVGVAEGDEDGGEIAHELVEGRRLRHDRFDEVRPDAVEHGVAELVVDDVGRQARVERLSSGSK